MSYQNSSKYKTKFSSRSEYSLFPVIIRRHTTHEAILYADRSNYIGKIRVVCHLLLRSAYKIA